MAIMEVCNESTGWLVLWLEPLGEDRWLRPGETFRIRSDYDGEEPAFTVSRFANDADRAAGIDNIAVWVDHGDFYAEVTDAAGVPVECGHHRPDDVHEKWMASLKKLRYKLRGE